MPYDYDAETQLAAAMQGIPLEQAMLQNRMRRAQGFADTPLPQGRQVGRVYRASSPLEALASALSRGLGARDMKRAEQDWQGLAGRAQQAGLAGARVARADKEREFGLHRQQADLANMRAMSEEQNAAATAQYRQDELGLRRQELGLRRSELAAGRDEKKRAASAKAAEDLRNEFQRLPSVKATSDMADAIGKIRAAPATGAGDLSLIYSYVKILDPGSVVREGEIALSREPTPLLTQLQQAYSKAAKGELLHPDLRAQYKDAAESLWGSQVQRYSEVGGPYKRLAEQLGVSPADVVIDYGYQARPADRSAPSAPRKTIGGKTYEKRPDGWYKVE